MNADYETVHLPDEWRQQLVHPLDVSAARGVFARAWVLSVVATPAAALCIAALAWVASRNVVVPLFAGLLTTLLGRAWSAAFDEQAWAHVPRRRQDRDRSVPAAWELLASFVIAFLFALALGLAVRRLGRSNVAVDVLAFTLGMVGGIASCLVVDLVVRLVLGKGTDRRRAWFSVPTVAVAVAGVLVSLATWFDEPQPIAERLFAWGIVTMLAVGATAGVGRRSRPRGEAVTPGRQRPGPE